MRKEERGLFITSRWLGIIVAKYAGESHTLDLTGNHSHDVFSADWLLLLFLLFDGCCLLIAGADDGCWSVGCYKLEECLEGDSKGGVNRGIN